MLLAGCGSSSNPTLPQLRPVEGGWISSGFGQREDHPVLGVSPGRMHDGYDFAVAEGTPIKATMAGEVVFAGEQGGYGKTVIIAHRDGYSTLYGHARELSAGPGDRVDAGEIVAFVGSTGLSTGPHLHYEVRKFGVAIDPGTLMPGEPPPTKVAGAATVTPSQPTGVRGIEAWDGEARPNRPALTAD
jgi:murein DD-endopeptidase MepM/ murein hydrolase activator NlpD